MTLVLKNGSFVSFGAYKTKSQYSIVWHLESGLLILKACNREIDITNEVDYLVKRFFVEVKDQHLGKAPEYFHV